MNRLTKPAKRGIALRDAPRPSRIRRDPPAPGQVGSRAQPRHFDPAEREKRIVVFGILSFAIALAIITVGAGDLIGLK